MEIKKSPALQWYPDKWLADTRRLSWKAAGIYHALLMTIWMQFQDTCSIPDDDGFAAAELGCSLEEWQEARKEIMWEHRPLLEIKTNRLFSKGLWKEKIKQEERRKKLAENGKKGGRPSKQENQEVFLEKPNDIQNESLPSPSLSLIPSPSPNTNLEEGKKERKTHPRLEVFREEYKSSTGSDYVVGNFKEHGGAAKRTVSLIPDDAVYRQAVRAYLAAHDKRIVEASFPYLWFIRDLNRWVGVAQGGNRADKFSGFADKDYSAGVW